MLTFQISEDNAKVILNALNMASKGNEVAFSVCQPIYSAIEKALVPQTPKEEKDGDIGNNDVQSDEK